MRRRRIVEMGLGALGASLPTLLLSPSGQTQTKSKAASLTLTWLGHMSFLFQDGNRRILSHPFKSIGCTAGLRFPSPKADLVMVSSELWDEGFIEALPSDIPVLKNPGAYVLQGITFQGIRMAHDQVQGRRFGFNVAWRWQQADIRILHLGGAAAPFLPEERILMGRPDLLILPVGGGAKSYNAEQAKEAVLALNPKIVVPTQYRGEKADPSCDLEKVDPFLELFPNAPVERLSTNTYSLTAAKLPQEMTIVIFSAAMPKPAAPQKAPPKKKPMPSRSR